MLRKTLAIYRGADGFLEITKNSIILWFQGIREPHILEIPTRKLYYFLVEKGIGEREFDWGTLIIDWNIIQFSVPEAKANGDFKVNYQDFRKACLIYVKKARLLFWGAITGICAIATLLLRDNVDWLGLPLFIGIFSLIPLLFWFAKEY